MLLKRCLSMAAIGGATMLSVQAMAAPVPRSPILDQDREALVIQIQQQQGQTKAKTNNRPSGNANRSQNTNRANTNRTTTNRSTTNRSNTNRTLAKPKVQQQQQVKKPNTTTRQQTVQKQQKQTIQKQQQTLNQRQPNVKMPSQQAIQRQARQLQLANRNQVRGNFKPAVYQSKLNTTFQSRHKQIPVVGKIRLAPPNWKHNPYMLAGLRGYKSSYRPFWFTYGGRPWYRWYYTALVGGVTYWYWSNLTREEVVEQKVVLTSYAGGDCGCEAPPPAPPECDCDDDDCGEQG